MARVCGFAVQCERCEVARRRAAISNASLLLVVTHDSRSTAAEESNLYIIIQAPITTYIHFLREMRTSTDYSSRC